MTFVKDMKLRRLKSGLYTGADGAYEFRRMKEESPWRVTYGDRLLGKFKTLRLARTIAIDHLKLRRALP